MDRLRDRSHRHPDRGWEGRRGGHNQAQIGQSGHSVGDVCFYAPRRVGYDLENWGHAPPAASPAMTYPNLNQPPPIYSSYFGYTGTASATAGKAGYQAYQAATAYSSLTAAPPPAAGSAYTQAGGQPGSMSGGYAAAVGQPGDRYGAPGSQLLSRPHPARQREVFQPKLGTSNINFISAGVQNQKIEKEAEASSGRCQDIQVRRESWVRSYKKDFRTVLCFL